MEAPSLLHPHPSDWPSDIDYDALNGSGSASGGGAGGLGFLPTPGGPLTAERVASLGIVKMNAYLVTGTRQQFWEEYFVKVIMQVGWQTLEKNWSLMDKYFQHSTIAIPGS